jgi:hypothetical protein
MSQADHHGCSSCFFTTDFPGVSITEDGRCNHCKSGAFTPYDRSWRTSNPDKLREIAAEIKRDRKGKYDCLIGASGGLDSSYVIFVAKKLLDLNPLVVSYDSGLYYDEAGANLRNLCESLGVDLRFVRSKTASDRKFIRSMIRAMRPLDVYWGICRFCGYAISGTMQKIAREHGITTTLVSHNTYEARLYLPRSFKIQMIKQGLSRSGILRLPRVFFHLLIAEYHLTRLKLELYVPPIRNLLKLSRYGPLTRHVTVSRYVHWDIDKMVQDLQEVSDWKPPNPMLPMRFDCMLEDAFINHTYQSTTGMTIHGIICNNLIYDGLRTRDQLKDVVARYEAMIGRRMRDVCERLGLKTGS